MRKGRTEGLTFCGTGSGTRHVRNVTRLEVQHRSMQVSVLPPPPFALPGRGYRDLDDTMIKFGDTTDDVPRPNALVPIHAFSRPHSHRPAL